MLSHEKNETKKSHATVPLIRNTKLFLVSEVKYIKHYRTNIKKTAGLNLLKERSPELVVGVRVHEDQLAAPMKDFSYPSLLYKFF